MGTGWDQQDAPPARGGHGGSGRAQASNYNTPVLRDELARWDDAWRKAEVREQSDGFAAKPDGTYIGQMKIARIDRTKSEGTPMLVIGLNILAGPASGEHMHRRVMGNSDQVKYVKQDLYNLGLDIGMLSDLPDYLPSLIDVCVEFALKTNTKNGKAYQNCYLNRALDPSQVDAAIAEIGDLNDNDIPF